MTVNVEVAAMARAGRKRRVGARRTPSGHISRAGKPNDGVLDDTLRQRAQAIGKKLTDAERATMKDQRLGTAIGRLWATEWIDERDHRALESLGALWRRWAAMAGSPPRTPVYGGEGRQRQDPDAERWQKAKKEMADIRESVRSTQYGALAWTMLESLCMDNIVPPRLMDRSWEIGWTALHNGLDAAARHFRIPVGLAA